MRPKREAARGEITCRGLRQSGWCDSHAKDGSAESVRSFGFTVFMEPRTVCVRVQKMK